MRHIKPVVLDSGSLFRYVLLLSVFMQKRRWKYVLSQANLTVPQTIYFSITSDIIKLRRSHLWSVSFWSPSVWNSYVIIVKNFYSLFTSDLSQFVSQQSSKKQVLVKSWLTFPQKKIFIRLHDCKQIYSYNSVPFDLQLVFASKLIINFVRGESSVAKEIQNANQKCYFSDHFKVGFQRLIQRCRSWVRLSSNPSRCFLYSLKPH